MQAKLQLGRKICEQREISPDELARLCHTGELTAYRFEDRHQILASSQCNMKFKFPSSTVLTLQPPNTPGILAVSRKSTEDFNVFVDRKFGKLGEKKPQTNTGSKTTQAIFEYAQKWEKRIMGGCRELMLNHKQGKYLLYYNITTVNPIRKHRSTPDWGYIENVQCFPMRIYGAEKIFFEAKKEGAFDIDFLELRDYSRGGFCRQTTKVCIERICDSLGEKFIIVDYDKDKICIENSMSACKACDMQKKEGKECIRKRNPVMRDACRFFAQKYSADYFKSDDVHFSKPLKLGIDFFIFDYDEYIKQLYFTYGEEDAREKFYECVENFVYDISELPKDKIHELLDLQFYNDPKGYMVDQCTILIKKYLTDDESKKIIKAYRLAIEDTGMSWEEIHRIIWPERKPDLEINNSYVSRQLAKFEALAEANGIPYIPAKELKDMTEKTRPQIVEKMAKQLEVKKAQDS